MTNPQICRLLLRRIGAVDYEPAGYLNTYRVPELNEPFDVRTVDQETVHARVVHIHAPPPGKAGEYTLRLDEIEKAPHST